jgi:uncharacterized protein (TIGR02996 family)
MAFPDEGFFHALQQNPEDDALRLVFADFLEDRGDDESSARAELIRVQVKLAALSPFTSGAAQQSEELTARQNELIARWQRVFIGEWADTLHGCTFRRGMVEAIHADASAFLDHAERWFAEWPTLGMAKLTGVGDRLPELAASPWLAHLQGLDLSKNDIDSSALAWLTSSRFICLLQALDLSDNPIGPRGAGLLATTRAADELSELHLARCGLWHEGLMALLDRKSAGPRAWRRLHLGGNGLYRLALVRLADSPLMSNLESLELAGNPLGDNGASVLADSPSSSGLIDLGLGWTDTGDREVAALAGSSNLKNLRNLDLRGHHCGWHRDRNGEYAGGIAELARSPLLGQLRRLLPAPSGRSNGWTTQFSSAVRPSNPLERVRGGWMATVLRNSRYLVPSHLECDLEELWWLGDTGNREQAPADQFSVLVCLEEFPELLDQMEKCQAAVLRLRYGLDGDPITLKEIGERLGMDRDTVRRVEMDALSNLWKLRRRIPIGW